MPKLVVQFDNNGVDSEQSLRNANGEFQNEKCSFDNGNLGGNQFWISGRHVEHAGNGSGKSDNHDGLNEYKKYQLRF